MQGIGAHRVSRDLEDAEVSSVATVLIEPKERWFNLELRELWERRELLYFFAWRDIKARYAQAVLGMGWAIIQPLAAMAIFTVVFSYWAKLPSEGVPYPLFAFAALLPWTLLSKSLERSGSSVVTESNLIKKVYFPRLIIPIAATIAGVMDFLVAFVLLLALMLWYGIGLTWGIILIPVFIVMTIATSLAVSLWLSAINARYRDVAGMIPLLSQLWMYASPVVYPVSIVPEQWQWVYACNPMVGVIEGFRWALLGTPMPNMGLFLMTFMIVSVVLFGGAVFFKRMERTFSDVV